MMEYLQEKDVRRAKFGRLVLGCKWKNELVKSWFVADIKYMMENEQHSSSCDYAEPRSYKVMLVSEYR